jgi:NAD(P)H dehydrogenase (quinone)
MQGGGQETTIMTVATQFAHHGMIFIPLGYTTPDLMKLDQVCGGSPWGAGTFAGAQGDRKPSSQELAIAKHQAIYFSEKARKLTK